MASRVGEIREVTGVGDALMEEWDWLRGVFEKVLSDMRIMKPHYYPVFREFYEHLLANGKGNIHFGEDGIDVEVIYGFYSELARRLGITRNAVKQRLYRAIKWSIRRAKWHRGREEKLAMKPRNR